MFDFFTDAVDNALDVTGSLLSGEAPDQRKVARLISAGLSVAAVASMLGVAETVIESIVEDD